MADPGSLGHQGIQYQVIDLDYPPSNLYASFFSSFVL